MTTQHWFVREGAGLRATGVAVSPHAPSAQHGGAVAALVARAADAAPSVVPMDIVRVTVDLTRVVPVGLVTTDVQVVREGRRLQLLDVAVAVDGATVSRSQVLRMHREEVVDAADLATVEPDDELPATMPERVDDCPSPWAPTPFMDGIRCTFEAYRPGRGLHTLHLHDQMVAGEEMTPATRAAVAADLVMTAGGVLPDYGIVNADLTLALHRLPVGEDIRIASTVRMSAGHGSTQGWLYDGLGCFGTVSKSLLVMGRRDAEVVA